MSETQRAKSLTEYRAALEKNERGPEENDPEARLYQILDLRKIQILRAILQPNQAAAVLEVTRSWPEYYEEQTGDTE